MPLSSRRLIPRKKFPLREVYNVHYLDAPLGKPFHGLTARIIGYPHGDLLVPMDPLVRKRVKALVPSTTQTRFSEHRELWKKRIDPPFVHLFNVMVERLPKTELVRLIFGIIHGGWKIYLKRRIGKGEPVLTLNQAAGRISNADAIKEVKTANYLHQRNPRETEHGIRLIITGRSLLMAANVIDYLQKHPPQVKGTNPQITIETGTGHLDELYLFLSKPKLGQRYARTVAQALKQWEVKQRYKTEKEKLMYDETIQAFSKAEKIFEKLNRR